MRGHIGRWPLAVAVLLSTIWLPALGRGFSSDDFAVVPTTWSQFLENPFIMDGRPVHMLLFALLPTHAFAHHALSLGIYIGCVCLVWRLCRQMGLEPWSRFLALSSLFHPAFLWSVTWISQRNSLLVILFLLAAIAATGTSSRLALIALGSASKAPYLFQDAVFSLQFARRGQRAAAAVCLLCMFVFGLAGYLTYYDRAAAANTLASPETSAAVSIPLRLAKLIEGITYIFAPIPMFAIAAWTPVLALIAYAALWVVVARAVRPARWAASPWIPAMALMMCLPFVFASEVRVVGEGAVLVFLALASALEWRPSTRVAAVGILALNLTAIALNYGAFRSSQFDIRATPVPIDVSQPAYLYQSWRETVRQRMLAALGVRTPLRSFE